MLTAPADALAGLAVETIAAWRAGGVDPADIAVLARVNSALLPVQVACMEAGVPCSTPLSAGYSNGPESAPPSPTCGSAPTPSTFRVEDILETVRRPSRGIAPKVVDMLTSRPTTSISDIRRLAGRLSGRDVPKLGVYASDLDTVVRGCKRSSLAALKAIRLEVGLGETMDVLDSSRSEADRSTHTDDLAALESVAALHPDVTTFEPWLREALSRTAGQGPLVLLSTIHRIKGREWDHVIIFDASRGLFPHRLGNDEEGERRVFHVALTRARAQVVALADVDAPSIFLAELDGTRVRPAPGSVDDRGGTGSGGTPDRKAAGNTRTRRAAAKGKGSRVFAEVALPTVEAVPGLVVDDRGTVGTVVEVTPEAAILSAGDGPAQGGIRVRRAGRGAHGDAGCPGLGRRGRRSREGPARLEDGPGEPGSGTGLCDLEGRRAGGDRSPGSRHARRARRLPGNGTDPPRALGRRDPGCP